MSVALCAGSLFLLAPGRALAATPAGTSIPNVGSVDFLLGPSGYTSQTNPTAVTVNAVSAVSISSPHAGTVNPGVTVSYVHTVSNLGNVPDAIDLIAVSSLGFSVAFFASDGVTPLADSNGNGRPDVGLLPPEGSVDIVVRLTVPVNAPLGQIDNTTVTAASAVVPSVTASVTDSTTVEAPHFWDPLVKNVSPSGQVVPGSIVSYTSSFGNAGGVPATNVVIADVLDANLTYIDGSATSPPGIAGTTIAYDPATRTLRWSIPSVPAGYTGVVGFQATVSAATPSDTVVTNRISVASDQSPLPQQSNIVSLAVVEQPLKISKTAGKTIAEIGDQVVYAVRVENTSAGLTADNVVVMDDLPHGFRYMKGSTTIDGKSAPDPAGGLHPAWPLGPLPPGTTRILSYRAIVSVDAMLGNGVNSAVVVGMTPGGLSLSAGPAKAVVKIQEGVLNSKGIILGRVFLDKNGDRMPADDEPGLKGARLYLEDGSYAVTDGEGKFSLYGLSPGQHVLKLDKSSLPPGLVPVPLNGAFAGDGGSQFISVPFGGPARGDFGLVPERREESREPESKGPENPDASPKKGKFTFSTEPGPNGSPPPSSYEVEIQSMPATAMILSPAQDAALSRNWTDIVVRVPEGPEHALLVNGVPLSRESIGKTIHESARKIFIHQYVGVKLSPGPNAIILEAEEPGGNRVVRKVTVTVPAPPKRILLSPDRVDIPADGKTTVAITASLKDAWDRPAHDTLLTVVTEKGTIEEADLDPSAPGHQVKAEGGKATFHLRAPFQTGGEKLKVLMGNDLEASADVFYTPARKDWIVAGIGEATVGARSVSGNVDKIKEKDEFKEGIFHKERLALFAKGEIGRGYVLTTAYDTGKDKREALFQRVEPDRYYPLYGDSGAIGYEAESQRKLYLKVEKDRSQVMIGDFRTDLSQTEFSRYDRAFNGVKADVDAGRVGLKAFATRSNQTITKDEIRGNGTSGFYFLKKKPVLENSEKVRIEIRDRYHPEKILSSVDKTPFTDYSIDYENGTLLFKEPVPTLDKGLNPVHIVIVYESLDAADEFYTYGGRVAVRPTGSLEIGATAVVEQKDLKDSTLYGVDAKLAINGKTRLTAEAAGSDTLEAGRGIAWKLEAESAVTDKLSGNLYYRKVDKEFLNPSMSGSEGGTEKYGGKAAYQASSTTTIGAEGFVQSNLLDGSKLTVGSLGVARKVSRATVEAGYKYLDEEKAVGDDRKAQMAYAGISGNLTDKLGASLRREQVFGSSEVTDYPTKTAAGLDYKITDRTRAYLTEEMQEGKGNRQNATVFGLESRVTENTTLSSRYQIDSAVSGERSQASIGLNNRWEVRKGITLNTRAERIQFLGGDGTEESGTALGFSAEYLPNENVKGAGRYEIRLGSRETTHLVTLGTAVKIRSDLSLLGKISWWAGIKDQGTDSTSDVLAGVAYRPKGIRSVYLLSTLRYKEDRSGSSGIRLDAKNLISSTEASFRVTPKLTLLGKYAGKYAWDTSGDTNFSAYTDLVIAGFTFDLTDRWELGLQAKLMNQYDTGMHALGVVARGGYRVYKNLYAGVGYNITRMDDRDLSGGSYQSHGPFFELKFKFDEETLRLTAPAAAPVAPAIPVPPAPPAPPSPPPPPGVIVSGQGIDENYQILGSVETLDLLINGQQVPLPSGEVLIKTELLEEVLEIKGQRLMEPILFGVDMEPNGIPARWRFVVLDAKGASLRTLSGEGSPPEVLEWDGKTEEGQTVSGGEIYQYQMEVTYQDGSRSTSARRLFGVNRTSVVSLSLTGSAFRFDSALLSPAARKVLSDTAAVLRKFPDEKIVVEGHTDDIGKEKYNLELSKRRAEAAVTFLVRVENLPGDRFIVRAYGKSQPIAGNDTPEGREINRRVEVKGEFSETRRATVRDQYRTEPLVKINRNSVEVDSLGRFATSVPGEAERIEVEMVTAQGRSVHTNLPAPRLEILEPKGAVRLPSGSQGENYRVTALPEGGEWKDGELVLAYRLAGRTEPGNTVELSGKPIKTSTDGTFSEMVDLKAGENVIGLLVRNVAGCTRIVQVRVVVTTERRVVHE